MAHLPPLIERATFEERLGKTLAGAKATQAEAFLDDASSLIRDVARQDFMDDGNVVIPDSLVPVVVRIVRRALDNPKGLTSESIGSYTWRRQGERGGGRIGEGGVWLTMQDRRDIKRAIDMLSVGALTLEGYLPIYREPIEQEQS